MVNFVIVEDNKHHIERTKEIVLNYMMKNSFLFDILVFSNMSDSLEELIENHDENHIYILDYELPDCTAIDIARLIRKYDWVSPIIIFTVNGGLAFESFKQRLQILDFVDKQVNASKNLFELFDICISQLHIRRTLKFINGREHYSIDYDKIKYIFRDTIGRKSVIVTEMGEYNVNKTLVEVYKQLNDKSFKFTHQACICNMNKVRSLNWKEGIVTFNDGEKQYFLSRSHKESLKEFYTMLEKREKKQEQLEEEKRKYS